MSTFKRVLLGIRIIFLGLLLGSLLGCGSQWFKDRSNDYSKAESHPRLKIPAKMNVQPFSEEYQIPDIKSETTTEKPKSKVESKKSEVNMEESEIKINQ